LIGKFKIINKNLYIEAIKKFIRLLIKNMSFEKNTLKSEEEELRWRLSSTGLSWDAANLIMKIPFGIIDIDDLDSIDQTYEEYITDAFLDYPKKAEMIIELSNQDSICQLNQLIEAYNSDLERIKKEEDKEALASFFNRIDKIIRWDKSVEISVDEWSV